MDGDVTAPNLGLNTKTIQELKDNVSVVFHNAASLKLEADLKHAVAFNLKGTKNVMEFCLQLPNVVVSFSLFSQVFFFIFKCTMKIIQSLNI